MQQFETTIDHGAWAETAASHALEQRGYRVVERNYRCKCGELDIVAYDGTTIVFVEVRSRSNADHGHAAEMVGRKKQRQVAKVALYYLCEREPSYGEARFDVVAITGGAIEIIQDAFRTGLM